MDKKFYSKSAQNLLRFFCIIGIIVEVLCITRLFIRTNFTLEIPEIHNFLSFCYSDLYIAIIDIVCLVVFIVLLFIPSKFEFFALISFFYSIKIITIDTLPENPLGFILYILGVSCLLFRDFYKKHTIPKIILTLGVYFALILHSLRIGLSCFIESLIITFGYGLAILSTIFFVVNFLKIIHVKRTARVWDLSQYPELTQRDKEWLRDILEEKRYEDIAKESGITVGTLKNRMHQIFAIIDVADRIGLLGTYGGYEVKF